MKIIEPSVEMLNPPDYQQMLEHVEAAGRTCYQSEAKGDPEVFIKRLIAAGHESVLEHGSISARFICDRGASHELVRHRLCSFSQESTRFCNYSGEKFGKELTFIQPMFWAENDPDPDKRTLYRAWENAMRVAEDSYFYLLSNGVSPQEARSVLPNSLKTDIVVTANIRQWRTVLQQRCAPDTHPQMRQVMLPLLGILIERYGIFFSDLMDLGIDGNKYFASKGWQLADIGRFYGRLL